MGGSSKLILGFVLAAMMAIDMGGPFNKAAYVFGTAAIASGNYDVMAAVMIGGHRRVRLRWQQCCLRRNLQRKSARQDRPTSSWVWHLSRRARFHLQRPIRYTCFQPASSVRVLRER
jgi:fructose-specific phosphotransferase system IIC component